MPQVRAEMEPQVAPARILVVEDEVFIRFAIADALRDIGASVVEAASADEAWQYLTAGGLVDLVFTDNRMPGSMRGAQLAARVTRQFGIAVVVTSAFFHEMEWSGPFIPKPYNLFETATALAKEALRLRRTETGQ
jgi:CheY-like chemotaxis protein